MSRYLHQLDSADRQEPSLARTTKTVRLHEKIARLRQEMQRLKGLEARMRERPDQQISLTDPDARSMATSGRGSGVVGYNVQAAVDTKHHLIVAHEVTNVGTDRSQLARMAKQTKATLGADTLDVVADRGYFNSAEILACEDAAITVTLPKPQTSGRYVAQKDIYICPANERLRYRYTTEEKGLALRRYWTNACLSCAIKHRCTTGRERRITSTSMFSRLFRGGSTSIRRRCASAARRSSIPSARSKPRWARNPLPDEDAHNASAPRWRCTYSPITSPVS